MFEDVFSKLATGFSQTYGGPFKDATATWPGTPVKDDGGSITTPGTPVSKACKAQVSAADERMRADPDFIEKDVVVYVLAGSLDGALDTDATVVVASGPHAGTYRVMSAQLDSAGIGWRCRGRKAS